MSVHTSQRLESTDLEDTGSNSAEIDEIFALLSNSRRRAALRILVDHGPLDFGDLVDMVAEIEYGRPIEDISGNERHTIYVSMQQTHLGRLEENDIVKRDRDTGTVELGPNANMMTEWISKIDGGDSIGSKLKRALKI
ncbi:DUF7344 domain-containing protein [Natrialba taiwanensis]|uniref:DUF7344 domain-containing protein n=1 Tax=Natrialba taiwanensis DSM 12281 TaxID=1230458 RepID=M0A0T2_9EURY|nr:hypothetical protein [Natrialba taiwanensis]ELY91442.1 hypothetical protein C484_10456 [Natrialba taiwanensis DSM 12281]